MKDFIKKPLNFAKKHLKREKKKSQLETLIDERIEELRQLTPGTKEHTMVHDELVDLIEKSQTDKEISDRTRSNWAKVLVDGALGVAGLALTSKAIKTCLSFEEEGVISSSTSKNVLGNVFRFKK